MNNIVDFIKEKKIVAIMRKVAVENVVPAARALLEGGIRLIEVTFDQSSPTAEQDTCKSIKLLCENFEGELCIGAGTVISTRQVELAIQAGAKYIISPNIDIEVIKKTTQLGAVSIPGALTPSEIVTAYNAGASFVKLFPVGNLGTSYIKAVKSPLSHIPLLAVGGVDENNMTDFFKAGVCGIGVGSNIVNNRLIDEGKFGELTELAKKYTSKL